MFVSRTEEIIKLLRNGNLYAGGDGSGKNGCGVHEYVFNSSTEEGKVWGGASIPLGSVAGMSSLSAEYWGALGVLLVLCALQIYTGTEDTSGYTVDSWIDNT